MYTKIIVLAAVGYLAGADCGRCGDNEVWNSCGSACEKTCTNLSSFCPQVCTGATCVCAPGYVRNDGKCIAREECPAVCQPCGENEECRPCGSACTPTCDNPNPICTLQCTPPRCECISGYVRNSEQVCVALGDCPAK